MILSYNIYDARNCYLFTACAEQMFGTSSTIVAKSETKVMTNNPNGFQKEIKIKGQRLEEVENFNYLGTIIS